MVPLGINLEGFDAAPRVPSERLRCGSAPAIAAQEIIEKTGGGVLAQPGDAASLAEAIYNLCKTPGLAADVGRKGAEGVREHYGATRTATRALGVFRSLTSSHAIAAPNSSPV